MFFWSHYLHNYRKFVLFISGPKLRMTLGAFCVFVSGLSVCSFGHIICIITGSLDAILVHFRVVVGLVPKFP